MEAFVFKALQAPNVADAKIDGADRALAGHVDETRGQVYAGDFSAGAVQGAADDALAAGQVQDMLAGLDVEKAKDAGDDDLLMEFRAAI
jgi:hypothetical protein